MEDLGEHGAAMHMNVIFVITFTLYLYRGATRGARLMLLLSVIPVGMAYLAAQRRAGVIALGVGLAFVVLTLWWRHRIKFFAVAPIMLIVVSGYTAAFWNNQSDAGFPAQAIKTVIAPDSASEKDKSSDEYRKAENFDINFTIKAAPVLGLGFGQAFYRPIPLPDISFFEFYQYIPHNSILWIWIKTGVFGFLSMMVMFAVAIRAGVATLVKERDPTAAALAIVGITYIAMFAVFAFVDIAWDSRNMVFLALAMALCSPSSVSSPAQPRGRPAEVNKEPVAALR
jgi:O-antigen ligase